MSIDVRSRHRGVFPDDEDERGISEVLSRISLGAPDIGDVEAQFLPTARETMMSPAEFARAAPLAAAPREGAKGTFGGRPFERIAPPSPSAPTPAPGAPFTGGKFGPPQPVPDGGSRILDGLLGGGGRTPGLLGGGGPPPVSGVPTSLNPMAAPKVTPPPGGGTELGGFGLADLIAALLGGEGPSARIGVIGEGPGDERRPVEEEISTDGGYYA